VWGVRKLRPCSWTHKEKSKVESCEHQDDANIHCQPFPEMVSEEHNIYTDYDGYHRHHVKHYSYLSAHFSQPSEKKRAPQRALVQWRKYQPPLSLRTATAHVSTQAIWRACTSKLAVNLLVAERNNNVDCVSAVMSASLHHAPSA
jgi:hypothetical protein